jgi:hypothetical protein
MLEIDTSNYIALVPQANLGTGCTDVIAFPASGCISGESWRPMIFLRVHESKKNGKADCDDRKEERHHILDSKSVPYGRSGRAI